MIKPYILSYFSATGMAIVSSALLIIALPAAAKDQKETQLLEDMVVTATRSKERAVDVPVATEVITKDKIELSGARHVGDVIGKYITGHYHKYNGLLSPVGLRGFRTEAHGDDVKGHVLMLIDGHRIGTGNAAKINVDRIEYIEVTKGPASALYGSAAMGGVINLITKKGDGDPRATVGMDFGSFSYFKGQASGGGQITDWIRFHATAAYEDVDDYHVPDYGRVFSSAETKGNIGGNLTFTPSPNQEIRVGGNYADLTGLYPTWKDKKTYSAFQEGARKAYDKSHAYADVEYNGNFFKHSLHWRSLAYMIWDRNHWKYGSSDPNSSQAKYTDTTLGTDHQAVWNMSSWNKAITGFTLEHLEKASEGVSGGEPSAPSTPGMRYVALAVFLQDSLKLWNNRINITGAVRYDHFAVRTLKPKTGDYPNFNEKSESYDHFSPKAGAGVKFFGELLRLRANVGQGFKSPSSDQLSADYIHTNGNRFVGNPDLSPETSLTIDAGVDIFHEAVNLKAGYFHTFYQDKIVTTSTQKDGQTTTTYKNHGDAEIAGVDVNLQWEVGRTFHFPFQLSLWSNLTVNALKDDQQTGEELLYISDYEVKSGLDVAFRGLSVQLSHVLVGPQKITNYDSSPAASEQKDSFHFWDLNLRFRFKTHWELRASLYNVFNQRVEWVRGFLMPQRNFRLGFGYTFS